MLEFTNEIDIDASENVESSQETKSKNNGVRRPNTNDEKYWNSLEILSKCRDLLTISEEQSINCLAERFKYLR